MSETMTSLTKVPPSGKMAPSRVPFLVEGPQKYWGQDRFEIWLEELA